MRFARDVGQARAEACAVAETRVHESDPEYWLRHNARADAEFDG